MGQGSGNPNTLAPSPKSFSASPLHLTNDNSVFRNEKEVTYAQSREWVDWSWVMGQMGHENRMGHMGHGSLGDDP